MPIPDPNHYEVEIEYSRLRERAINISIPVGSSRAKLSIESEWVNLERLQNEATRLSGRPFPNGKGISILNRDNVQIGRYRPIFQGLGFSKYEDGSMIINPILVRTVVHITVDVVDGLAKIEMSLNGKSALRWTGPTKDLNDNIGEVWIDRPRTGLICLIQPGVVAKFHAVYVRSTGAKINSVPATPARR